MSDAGLYRKFAEIIAELNSYTVEIDTDDACPRCGSEDNPVPICVDGVFKDHCRSCAHEVVWGDY